MNNTTITNLKEPQKIILPLKIIRKDSNEIIENNITNTISNIEQNSKKSTINSYFPNLNNSNKFINTINNDTLTNTNNDYETKINEPIQINQNKFINTIDNETLTNTNDDYETKTNEPIQINQNKFINSLNDKNISIPTLNNEEINEIIPPKNITQSNINNTQIILKPNFTNIETKENKFINITNNKSYIKKSDNESLNKQNTNKFINTTESNIIKEESKINNILNYLLFLIPIIGLILLIIKIKKTINEQEEYIKSLKELLQYEIIFYIVTILLFIFLLIA